MNTEKLNSDRPPSEAANTGSQSEKEVHWLVRPSTIKKLWVVFFIVLGLTLLAQAFVHIHEYFAIDEWFGFYAFYGFFSCVAMVIVAKLLGLVLKQPDDFYDE